MDKEVNVLALVKDGHRFVFLYDDSSKDRLLQTFGEYAADPELTFSWYDAAVLSQRIHQGGTAVTPHSKLRSGRRAAMPSEE